MGLVQIMFEGQRGMLLHRVQHHVVGDERVAVAVAADPAADAQQRRNRDVLVEARFKLLFQIGVYLRDFSQEGVAVIFQSVVDFVAHCQSWRGATCASATGSARNGARPPRFQRGRPVSCPYGRDRRERWQYKAGSRGCFCAALRSGAQSVPAIPGRCSENDCNRPLSSFLLRACPAPVCSEPSVAGKPALSWAR